MNRTDVITIDHMMDVCYNAWRVYNMAPNYSKKAFIKEMAEQSMIKTNDVRVQWLHSRARCFTGITSRTFDQKLPLRIRVAMQKVEVVYISETDYTKHVASNRGQSFTRALRSDLVAMYNMQITMKGQKQDIWVEEYPGLQGVQSLVP